MLLFDPVALDPSGKTKIGTVVPNRDATRARRRRVRAGPRDPRTSASSTRTTGAQIGPVDHRARRLRLGARRALCVHHAAHAGIRREAGAASLLSQHRLGGDRTRRRADDRDEATRRTIAPSTSPKRPTYGVRDRRFLVEHDSHPSARLDGRAADDLCERQVPRRSGSSRKDRLYFRTNDNAPNWKLMAADPMRKPEIRDWATLIARAGDRAGRRVTVTSTGSSSRRCARTCCRGSSCTTWRASACASSRCRCSAT